MVTTSSEIRPVRDGHRAVPDLKRYDSYRKFLLDWYQHRKSLRAGFSYRRFSAMLSLKSPNFLQLVILGERNLSAPLAARLCKLLQLNSDERAYFLALVEAESAGNEKEREEAEKNRRIALRKLLTTPMTLLHERIFSRWYHMLVRELVFLPDFEFSGEYVSRRLNGLISAAEGEESLNLLLKAGFVVYEDGPDGGRYRAASPVLDSGDGIFTHELMQKHHGETLATWGWNLGKLPKQELELGLLHIPIRSDRIPELKARIRRFQDEIIGWLESERDPDRLVQLGTYLIPFQKAPEKPSNH